MKMSLADILFPEDEHRGRSSQIKRLYLLVWPEGSSRVCAHDPALDRRATELPHYVVSCLT